MTSQIYSPDSICLQRTYHIICYRHLATFSDVNPYRLREIDLRNCSLIHPAHDSIYAFYGTGANLNMCSVAMFHMGNFQENLSILFSPTKYS